MDKKYNFLSAKVQLQPVVITVVLSTLSVACLLLGTVSVGPSQKATGAYQITAER